jgi:hypothetical protein
VTLQVQSGLLASWAVGEWNVVVGNVVEEMDFVLVKEKTSSNRMYGSITPTLVEESTILVERFEVVEVGFRSEPIEVTDFEVGPLRIHISKDFWKIIRDLPYGNGCRSLRHHHSRNP